MRALGMVRRADGFWTTGKVFGNADSDSRLWQTSGDRHEAVGMGA
jgi:hypothetical protein